MVIHNAAFDMKFLNAELGWLKRLLLPMAQSLDTLAIARRKFPGSPASLDALCRRFGIDNSNRTLHGALLDSEILAEVYLELIGGRQPDFGLGTAAIKTANTADAQDWRPTARPNALPPRITNEEAAAHTAFIESLGDGVLWNRD
jgi:DNA polymerase-3 subunit epsilon